jgi:hypothetical protein
MKKSCSFLTLLATAVLSASAAVQDLSANPSETGQASTPQTILDDEPDLIQNIPVVMPEHDSVLLVKTAPRDSAVVLPDTNVLLAYIQSYDVSKHLLPAKAPRVFKPKEVLDYPRMSPLFMPLVFNSQRRKYHLDPLANAASGDELKVGSTDSLRLDYQSNRFVMDLAQKILQNAEIQQLGKIVYDQKNLPEPEKLVYQLDSKKPTTWVKPSLPGTIAKPDTKNLPKTPFDPWRKFGYSKFQLTQTYVSPNWSKGGESNMAGLAQLYLEANYRDSKNVAFDNSMDVKIGLNTVSNDTLRNLNVSTDQLRILSKLGIRMYNDWYYTVSGEFTTQFLNNYKTNTWNMKSSLFSPAKLFVGLGIDYKKADRKKGYDLSVLVSPITVKMNYLYDIEHFKPANYGIEDGKHFGKELGSKVAANLTWTFSEQVKWTSKFYYYTDFTYVDTDWENTLDLSLNNNFTTSIYVHLKADDRLEHAPGEPLIQMQELFSFGMMYRW